MYRLVILAGVILSSFAFFGGSARAQEVSAPATIVLTKHVQGTNRCFDFRSNLKSTNGNTAFCLRDGDSEVFTVAVGTELNVREHDEVGYDLKDVSCDGQGNFRGRLNRDRYGRFDRFDNDRYNHGLSITPQSSEAGQVILCTFTNVPEAIATPTVTMTPVPTSTPSPQPTPIVVVPTVTINLPAPSAPAPVQFICANGQQVADPRFCPVPTVAPVAPTAPVVRPPNTGSGGLLPSASLIRNEWGDGDDYGNNQAPDSFGPIPPADEWCW